MNRDIEFRGLTGSVKGDIWVYGTPYKVESLFSADERYYIRNKHTNDHIVDPKTIGQYTGLKDKNGKKIFEGDIVKNEDYTLAIVYNPKVQGFVLTDKNDWLNEPTDRIYDCDDIEEKFINKFFEYNCVSYEVIGNIYENKELLEG